MIEHLFWIVFTSKIVNHFQTRIISCAVLFASATFERVVISALKSTKVSIRNCIGIKCISTLKLFLIISKFHGYHTENIHDIYMEKYLFFAFAFDYMNGYRYAPPVAKYRVLWSIWMWYIIIIYYLCDI